MTMRWFPALCGSRLLRGAGAAVALAALSGCGALERLEQIGQEPPLSKIQNPAAEEGYEPVILPMPPQQTVALQPSSLWEPGARQFFKDQRASQIGDILTVNVSIADSADIENTTERTRTTTEDDSASALLGLESKLNDVLPNAVDPTNLISTSTESRHTGDGSIERNETINTKVAAIVTQVLPNGNLVVHGRQEIRVNFEVREIMIDGVVRPEDITSSNTIDADKIAEARIAYGGRGQLTDIQQPRYGTQIIDIIYPF